MSAKKQTKISILVPCYNVERFLPQCLDSIVGQTLKDIEIICINDGSTDTTLDIIKQYAAKDKRIKIIDKENEGYGKSMNRGLEAATGQYIGIVESDDWVDDNMFENLVKIADETQVDMVKSNYYEYTKDINKKLSVLPDQDCGCVIDPKKHNNVFWCPPAIWSGIYRRDFLSKNNIKFLESPGASYQDLGFNFKALIMANSVFLTNDAFLHYRCDNVNSSVKSSGKIFCVCDEWDEVDKYITEHPKIKNDGEKLLPYIKLGSYLWNLDRLSSDAQNEFLTRFQSEYINYIQQGRFNKSFYSDRQWYNIMSTVFPNSRKYKLAQKFFDVIHPIYRTKISNNKKIYKILGLTALKINQKL